MSYSHCSHLGSLTVTIHTLTHARVRARAHTHTHTHTHSHTHTHTHTRTYIYTCAHALTHDVKWTCRNNLFKSLVCKSGGDIFTSSALKITGSCHFGDFRCDMALALFLRGHSLDKQASISTQLWFILLPEKR